MFISNFGQFKHKDKILKVVYRLRRTSKINQLFKSTPVYTEKFENFLMRLLVIQIASKNVCSNSEFLKYCFTFKSF